MRMQEQPLYIDDFESDDVLTNIDSCSGNTQNKNNNVNTSNSSNNNISRPLSTNRKSKRNIHSWIKAGNWTLGDNIGQGSFGTVYQCMNNTGKLYAVKKIEMSIGKKDNINELVHEIDLMKNLLHINIVQYIGAYVDENNGYLYIFQEWVSGGSVAHLLKRFGPFSESVTMNYTKQVCMRYMYTCMCTYTKRVFRYRC